MYCKYCGKKISENSKFCSYCGKSLIKIKSDKNVDECTAERAEEKYGIISAEPTAFLECNLKSDNKEKQVKTEVAKVPANVSDLAQDCISVRNFDKSDKNDNQKMQKNADTLFQQACEFARKNEFEKAMPFFEQAAELGHDGAIASLATIYIDGQGVKQDLDKGLWYLHKGVNNGDAYLINYLG